MTATETAKKHLGCKTRLAVQAAAGGFLLRH